MALGTTFAGNIELRRQEVSDAEEISGGVFEQAVFVDIQGAGEAVTWCNFGVRFIERPALSTGFEMARNQRLIAGHFPTVNAGIYVWKYGKRLDTGSLFYDGATVTMRTTGPSNLLVTVHLTFRGRAIRNPAGT